MNAGELCNREVVVAHCDEPLLEGARRMRDGHVGALMVVESDAEARIPVGILTDRDIVVAVLARDPEDLTRLNVGDVMSFELTLARESESLSTVLEHMRRQGVRRVPVVDDAGALVGVLSLDDILEELADELLQLARVPTREIGIERLRRN